MILFSGNLSQHVYSCLYKAECSASENGRPVKGDLQRHLTTSTILISLAIISGQQHKHLASAPGEKNPFTTV